MHIHTVIDLVSPYIKVLVLSMHLANFGCGYSLISWAAG